MQRIDRSSDDGGSLIFVLVFMILVSALALATLSFIQVSFEVGDGYRENRQENYTAEAALELAIDRVVKDPTGNLGSPGHDCDFTVDGVNGRQSKVVCRHINGAGAGDPSKKAFALLALSQTEAFTLGGNKPLNVTGDVHTNAAFATGQTFNKVNVVGALTSAGRLTPDECGSAIKITAVTKDCAAPLAGDPGFGAPAQTSTLLNERPSCSKRGPVWVAEFIPGQYSISPSDPHFIDFGSCKQTQVLYFTPGVYSFASGLVLTTDNLSTSTKSDYFDIVAGTAGSWLGTGQVPSVEGACNPAGPGSQFVLGSGARIEMPNLTSNFHVCSGPSAAGLRPLAIHGGAALTSENKPSIFVSGRIYMPAAKVKLVLQGASKLYLRGGLVADAIELDWSPSSPQLDPPIEADTGCIAPCRSDRHVEFIASIGSEKWTRAVVKFNDAGGTDPAHPHTIESWTVLPAGSK